MGSVGLGETGVLRIKFRTAHVYQSCNFGDHRSITNVEQINGYGYGYEISPLFLATENYSPWAVVWHYLLDTIRLATLIQYWIVTDTHRHTTTAYRPTALA